MHRFQGVSLETAKGDIVCRVGSTCPVCKKGILERDTESSLICPVCESAHVPDGVFNNNLIPEWDEDEDDE